MGFDSIRGNDKAKRIIRNEILKYKTSGTYLFSGYKGLNTAEYAIGFAQALNCLNLKGDFCGYCSNCIRIAKGVHPDCEIIEAEGESIKIEKIREVIREAASSVYESGKKVFVIKNIDKLRHESANALLKTIEEPEDNVFFILVSNSMDILPTIISRSIVIDIFPETPDTLGIDKKIYDFMDGDVDEIQYLIREGYNFEEPIEYINIGIKIKAFLETKEISLKADIRKCAIDFINKSKFMSELEKITVAEDIDKNIGSNRWFLKDLLMIFIKKNINLSKIEKLLEIKGNINYNINTASTLYLFFLNI